MPTRIPLRFSLAALLAVGMIAASGTVAQADTAEEEPFFTIAVIPDTQGEVDHEPKMLKSQTQYLRDHADELGLAMVLHEGDIVQHVNSSSEWATARKYFGYLDGVVPMVFASGNHDQINYSGVKRSRYTSSHTRYDRFLRSFDHYRVDGQYKKGSYANTYTIIEALDTRYVVISLQYGANDSILAWAKKVAKKYATSSVIMLTHDYLDERNRLRGNPANGIEQTLPSTLNPSYNNGYDMWTSFVKPSSNVKFVFSGHVEVKSLGKKWAVGFKRSVNASGRYVYQMMANFQMYRKGGGYIRLVTIYPESKRVEVRTYSPYYDDEVNGGRDQFAFESVTLAGQPIESAPDSTVAVPWVPAPDEPTSQPLVP